jgi:hypothetical protein
LVCEYEWSRIPRPTSSHHQSLLFDLAQNKQWKLTSSIGVRV